MSAQTVECPTAAAPPPQPASFFRQSGWMMMANVAGGVLMWGVHFLNKLLPAGEYGSFGAMVAVTMLLPSVPLQMIMAQQTAKAIAQHREREVSGVIHAAWLTVSLVWLVGAGIVLLLQRTILERWHLQHPAGLWITLAVLLFSLWLPMFWGVMQGQQSFFWLGWSMLANGVGRLAVAGLVVGALSASAAGMMTGVLLGILASLSFAAWQTRRLWWLRAQAFDWRGLVQQVVPLTLGFLAFQVLFTADTILMKAYFSGTDADCYVGAGTLSRALMWLVLPLAAVMFPRLVHSAARKEKSNLMGIVLLATGGLAAVGALSLSLLGPWIVRIVYKPESVALTLSLLPWYAGAMVPLALANVLLNNLLARPAATLVPALSMFAVAVGYVAALTQFHDSLVTVLKVLCLANVALLLVCAGFTLRGRVGGAQES